jgi:hypothetical protein
MHRLKLKQFPVPVFPILILLLAGHGIARTQSFHSQFFPETGHTLRGEFLDFFNRNKDLVLVLVPD